MERSDIKKQGGYEANYNAGWVTTDESTASLQGSRAEVEVIVEALELLVLERKKLGVLHVPTEERGLGGPYYHPQTASPEAVLKDIREPKFAESSE